MSDQLADLLADVPALRSMNQHETADGIEALVAEVRVSRVLLADVRTVHSGAPVSLVEYHEALRRLREAAAGGAL